MNEYFSLDGVEQYVDNDGIARIRIKIPGHLLPFKGQTYDAEFEVLDKKEVKQLSFFSKQNQER